MWTGPVLLGGLIMTIREAIGDDYKFDGSKITFDIGFNGDDETELTARSIEELEELWRSLVEEFETTIDGVEYANAVFNNYQARVSFCDGKWCGGTIVVEGYSVEDARETAIDYIGVKLYKAFPELDIEYSVEIIEEE